jgi:hypothetical protein
MVKKVYQNPEGGLNAKGRAYFKNKEGANLKPPVSSKEAGVPGPMKDSKGRPTRKALALKKWDC